MACRLLIVDDDTDFRSELKEAFEDFDVLEASSGEEAVKLIKSPNDIDLIILDVRLPGIDGPEALRRIKELSPLTGVIMLTGYGSKGTVIDALRGRADDYIEKPVDILKLRQRVTDYIDSRECSGRHDDTIEGKIERVKSFVEKNYSKNVRLEDAAESVHLSPKYLSRVFKRFTGVGFSDYKVQMRMAKARELLNDSAMSVNRIAYSVGYLNPESFMRTFKKITGYTPSEYRSQ